MFVVRVGREARSEKTEDAFIFFEFTISSRWWKQNLIGLLNDNLGSFDLANLGLLSLNK